MIFALQGVRHMSSFLMHVWSKACKLRPLVIMIDGIDQVKSYGSTSLEWVPRELPEHVKLIMTVRDDSPQMTQLQTIIEDSACFLKVRVGWRVIIGILYCNILRVCLCI